MFAIIFSAGFWLSIMPAFAAEAPARLVRFYPSEVLRNETVEFRPVDNHHFSFEAPQNCGSGSLNEKNPRVIKCQFLTAGETQATLNVCDDKKTYCKPIQLKIKVLAQPDGAAGTESGIRKNEHVNKELKKTLIAGFVEGSPKEIIQQAAAKKQPVLVMVSTDWCPPCNESKEFLLPSQAFKTATQDWFKVYVDGDSALSAEWEKTVPYRYFPSYVALNAQMQEIGRYTGEIRQSEFAAWAKEQAGLQQDPIAQLRARVDARQAGLWKQRLYDLWNGVSAEQKHGEQKRLLEWALDQKENGLVESLLAAGDYPHLRSQILQYQIEEVERVEQEQKKDLKADKAKLYEALLKETLNGEHWSTHLEAYCELDQRACRPHLERVSERMEFLNKREGLLPAEKASAVADEYFYLSEVYRALDEKKSLKEFAGRCVAQFESMQKDSALRLSRAGQQGMVACLELAGDFAREEKALKALVQAYPNEPTFLWRMARMRRKQKKDAEALAYIGKAESLAYGYNWFSIEVLKAEILLEAKKLEEARQVIKEALAQVELDPSSESRNQRLVARLRNIESAANNLSGK